ncbi:hypothetical protein, partial [Massilia genomosp. 1]|uniref:hypothetical protein n=1 Tax=Massilia genomosp. 1 TaxID=2609280 RepID=UPI001420A341
VVTGGKALKSFIDFPLSSATRAAGASARAVADEAAALHRIGANKVPNTAIQGGGRPISSKLSFDSSLNPVEKIWSVEASKILAENPIAMRSYQRLQRQGTDVRYVNDPDMKDMGLFDQYSNTVTINMLRHSSAKEAVSTIIHEAKHQHRFYRTGEAGTIYEEYLAFRNESLFTTGVRPARAERMNIYNDVKQLYKDKDLPLGQYPFGGKR